MQTTPNSLARILGCALLTLTLAAPVAAQTTVCDVGAWTNDMAGPIDVYAEPDAGSAVLGQLPIVTAETPADYEYPVQFTIKAANRGWLKIEGANDDYNVSGTVPARKVYGGTGWIKSDRARVGVQSARGYAEPDTSSQRVLDLKDSWLTEVGRIRNILACSGDWLLIDYAIEGQRADQEPAAVPQQERLTGQAWFKGICSIQETTCDMTSVDQ